MNETELVDVRVQRVPITKEEHSVQYVLGYTEYVFFTFYCDKNDQDYKFTLFDAEEHKKISTMKDHPLYCEMKDKDYECVI